MRGRLQVVAALSCAVLVLAGCADDQDKSAAAPDEASLTAAVSVDERAQMRVGAALVKEGSAGATALTLVRDVRDGAGPILVPAYDSRIIERVGVSNLIGALESVRQVTQQTTPVVVRQRRATYGELVVVRLLREEGKDSNHAFLLRRQGGRWVIAYDALLAEGLTAYIPGARSSNPAKPSVAANKDAARAVAELRLAARKPRAKRPRAEESPTQTTPGQTTQTQTAPTQTTPPP